jgi:hypothetical protein
MWAGVSHADTSCDYRLAYHDNALPVPGMDVDRDWG